MIEKKKIVIVLGLCLVVVLAIILINIRGNNSLTGLSIANPKNIQSQDNTSNLSGNNSLNQRINPHSPPKTIPFNSPIIVPNNPSVSIPNLQNIPLNNLPEDTFVPTHSFSMPKWAPIQNKFRGGNNSEWYKNPDIARLCGDASIIEIPGVGSIKWYGCINGMYANLDRDINITDGTISLDSFMMDPSFNSSAELTMNNLSFSYVPAIYRNGVLCNSPKCEIISFSGSTIMFKVSSFSSYTLGVNARLDVWDETDPSTKPYAGYSRYPLDTVYFYADYKNITSQSSIISANCSINFTDSSGFMVYNATKGLYEYSRTFSSAGAYLYNITCSASGFASLNTSDYSSVQTSLSQLSNSKISGANVTAILSSRASLVNPDNASSIAGNVTESQINGKTITQAWQGYYGNVSGIVTLSNGNGDVLYNWSESSPRGEVYASRSFGVNFANISCASQAYVQNEENNLGQLNNDADSITNTFNQNSHPQFFSGSISIAQNGCKSTNIFNSSGSQASYFYEVILSDDSANIVYASILENDILGFDNNPYDFQMIVSEDGHLSDTSPTPYFFYLEIQ